MQPALPPDPPAAVIVVTGNALPETRAERAHHVDDLDRRELSDSAAQSLDSILTGVPGLQLFRRSDSTSGHPTSQGITLRALGGNASSRAVLVLDGVPQADPFGGWINWPAYDPGGIESVRVVRGGGIVSHGPGALAGLIDLQSRSDRGLDASLEAGSRESLRGHFYAGAALGGGLVMLDAQGGRSDGFVPVTKGTRGPIDRRAPFEQASVRARWVTPLGGETEAQVGGLGFIDRRERGLPFTGNRTRGADLSVRLVGRGRWGWSALGYVQWRNLRSSFAGANDDRTIAQRVSLQDSVPSRGFGGSIELRQPVGGGGELRLGADTRLTDGESRELFAYSAGQPTRRRIAGGEATTVGLFADSSFTSGAWTLFGSARLDRWTIADGELVERLLATGVATRDDHFPRRSGWRETGRVGALLDAGGGWALRSAAYAAWRMPTLNELFRPFRAGPDATAANALLDPERLIGAEVGADYERGPVRLSLTGFSNRLKDSIANVTLGQGPGVFPGVGFVAGQYRQRRNIDHINVTGLEASVEMRKGPWWAHLGASYSNARVRADGPAAALDGLRPAQTPRFTATAEVGWSNLSRSASLQLRHVGAQLEDDLNHRRLRPATTLDAFVAWPLGETLELIGRAQNLFDATVIAGLAEDGTAERATPRTLWLGVRIR